METNNATVLNPVACLAYSDSFAVYILEHMLRLTVLLIEFLGSSHIIIIKKQNIHLLCATPSSGGLTSAAFSIT